jgi:hypothetical protein
MVLVGIATYGSLANDEVCTEWSPVMAIVDEINEEAIREDAYSISGETYLFSEEILPIATKDQTNSTPASSSDPPKSRFSIMPQSMWNMFQTVQVPAYAPLIIPATALVSMQAHPLPYWKSATQDLHWRLGLHRDVSLVLRMHSIKFVGKGIQAKPTWPLTELETHGDGKPASASWVLPEGYDIVCGAKESYYLN